MISPGTSSGHYISACVTSPLTISLYSQTGPLQIIIGKTTPMLDVMWQVDLVGVYGLLLPNSQTAVGSIPTIDISFLLIVSLNPLQSRVINMG